MSEDDFNIPTVQKLSLKCPTCDSTFSHRCSLLRHIRTIHKDGKGSIKTKTFHCAECSKSFSNSFALLRHCRAEHGKVKQERNEMKCSIELCKFTCRQMKELIGHLNENHNQHLEYEHLQFRTETDFKEWQAKVEKEVPCRFLLRKRGGLLKEKSYYYCNRSGSSNMKPSGERKRQVKTQGSCKIQRTCTAHFVEHKIATGLIEVKYIGKHFCHTNKIDQMDHIRLPERVRIWLTAKLAKNTPLEIILQDVRSDLEGNHIVTKQDLRNIQRAFRLNRSERFHGDGESEGNSPIMHITQLSHHIPDLEENRRTALKLCNDISVLINGIEIEEHMLAVIECLKAVKSKLRAITAGTSSSTNFVLTTQSK